MDAVTRNARFGSVGLLDAARTLANRPAWNLGLDISCGALNLAADTVPGALVS